MDLGFFRRAEQRFASRTAAQLEIGMFAAMLQTRQRASAAALAQARCAAPSQVRDPIAEILLAGPQWRLAVRAQGGCFSPALARKGAVN